MKSTHSLTRVYGDHSHVERVELLSAIETELGRSGIVVVGAPYGYGKSTLLRDYARVLHAHAPSRPIVRVDLGLPAIRERIEREGRPGADRSASGPNGERTYRSTVAQIAWERACDEAPEWVRAVQTASVVTLGEADMPFMAIDDLPAMEEGELELFADAVRLWVRSGLQVVVASVPSASPAASQFSDVLHITSSMMSVSPDEMPRWASALCLRESASLQVLTAGVPMLIDACRNVPDIESAPSNPVFLQRSERILRQCLAEPMCQAAERARIALAMLGEGDVGDLASVGVSLRSDDLAILTEEYPLFGIDAETGRFACIPVPEKGMGVLGEIVARDSLLAQRCAELLAVRGNPCRAGAIASLLPDGHLADMLSRHPDLFADVACDGAIARCLRSLAGGPGCEEGKAGGLSQIDELHAFAHDEPYGGLGTAPQDDEAAGLSAARAVRAVAAFWRGYSGSRSVRLFGIEGDEPIEELCARVGMAGLSGDERAFEREFERFERAIDFDAGGLAVAVCTCHAAMAAMACGEVSLVLGHLEALELRAAATRSDPRRPGSASDALLTASAALGRLLVEKPPASAIATASIAQIRGAREFFAARGIAPGEAFVSFLEAFCLMASGRELEAKPLLQGCLARWSMQGNQVGQMVANLGLCVTCLAQGAVNQSKVSARTAYSIAQRIGARSIGWVAHMFEMIGAARNETAVSIDSRLLDDGLRQSSLRPRVCVPLEIGIAFMNVARGNNEEARATFEAVNMFDRPDAARQLRIALRCSGGLRERIVELLPPSLRGDLEGDRRGRILGSDDARHGISMGFGDAGGRPKEVEICLLGGFRVSKNGHLMTESEWGRRRSRQLLMILSLFTERPLSRDMVIEMLWPGRTSPTVRNNLSTTLTTLRASLGQKNGGPEYIISVGNGLMLNHELVDIDVVRFERLARGILMARGVTESSEVLEACSQLARIFQGGVDDDARGIARVVRGRADELSGLFADCMVFASGTALDIGDAQLALWFARAAQRVFAGRSDVERAMRLALEESGRMGAELGQRADRLAGFGAAYELRPLPVGDAD